MKFKITSNSHWDSKNNHLFHHLYDFSKKRLKFERDIDELFLLDDIKNEENPLGLTAYYQPASFQVVLYTSGRHIKDLLRSFAHELVHHKQNCENKLETEAFEQGYAQNNPHLRKLEEEAYLIGNMNMRDWSDNYKKGEGLIREWTSLLMKTQQQISLRENKGKKNVQTKQRNR